jgi:superfamily I DNA and/or RNA helicase
MIKVKVKVMLMEKQVLVPKPVTQSKTLNQQITLRTVDDFQGEKASIVMISLVCNFFKSGELGEYNNTIGFLKKIVLLSRAREEMYLIGNSELMALNLKICGLP